MALAPADEQTKWSTLLNKLLQKTQSGELQWERTAAEGEFQAPLGEFAVGVSRDRDGVIWLILYTSDGRFIDSIRGADAAPPSETRVGDKDDFPRREVVLTDPSQELWELARRTALGVNSALDSVLASLG